MLTYHFQRWYQKVVMVVVIFVWTLLTFDFQSWDWKIQVGHVGIGKVVS